MTADPSRRLVTLVPAPNVRPTGARRLSAATRRLFGDAIFGASTFIFLSTIVLTLLGVAFWAICARYFSPSDVGVATGLLAGLNIVGSLSLLGLEIALIRYLPSARAPATLTRTAMLVASAVSLAVGTAFVLLAPVLAPSLTVLYHRPLAGIGFVVLTPVAICSYLLDSVLISRESTGVLLGKNTLFSVFKLVLLASVIGLGALGIYTAWMGALLIAVAGTWWYISSRLFRSAHGPRFSLAALKPMWRFSGANYLASLAEGLPIMVLPLFVLYFLGSVDAARYYLAMMMCGVLYLVATAGSQALFAEGSRSGDSVRHVQKTAKFIGIVLIPGTLFVLAFGVQILGVFGATYAQGTQGLVTTLALAAPVVAVAEICRAILKVRHANTAIAVTSTVAAATVLILAYAFRSLGLTGVGLAWLIGQGAAALLLGAAVAQSSAHPHEVAQ